jgi:hypothetical protein
MKTSAELQRQSLFRKLTYFGLILVLFSATTLSGRVVSSATGKRIKGWTVSEQAEAMQLRETTRGHSNVLGSTIQVSLTGSRGFAVCVLWMTAIEKQKRHEWNELKLLVNVITKLQPHFLTPWLFQSWNLAYNVSVESDRVVDKYFYITEGISLLAEGERINRGRGIDSDGQEFIIGNPDMRFWIGFYYMNKFGLSDENNYLRCLYQLSCIEPSKRDPAALRASDGRTVDLVKFHEFVRQNPYLCRRLRDLLRCSRPEDVVDFLADNRKLPSRYEEVNGVWTVKRNTEEQFPVLPDSPLTADRAPPRGEVTGEFDNYYAGWAWMTFAQEPLPPVIPGKPSAGVPPYNPLRYRMARSPMSILFRQYPPRCQSYIAERLQREGWFGDEGWTVDEGHLTDRWFPNERVVAGNDRRYSSQEAWGEAYRMWRAHGQLHGLSLEQNVIDSLDARADLYRRKFQVPRGALGPSLSPDQVEPELYDSFDAHQQLCFYRQNLTVTNFSHFLYGSEAEADPKVVDVRRLIFAAERQKYHGNPERAIQTFQDAFARLCGDPLSGRRGILEEYPNFRGDTTTQEDLYEKHIEYLRLLEDHRGISMRNTETAVNLFGFGARAGFGTNVAGCLAGLLYFENPKVRELPPLFAGPLDGRDSGDKPWISEFNTYSVRMRMGLVKPGASPGMPGMPASRPPGP